MDILTTRSIEIASLALDGLSARHKAIASNIANADTPDYKRVDVNFENQLQRIIFTQDMDESKKLKNSGNPMDAMLNNSEKAPMSVNHNLATMQITEFQTEFEEDNQNPPDEKGNTVNIEQEMSYLTKNGMTYNALAALESKAFKGLAEAIRSGQ